MYSILDSHECAQASFLRSVASKLKLTVVYVQVLVALFVLYGAWVRVGDALLSRVGAPADDRLVRLAVSGALGFALWGLLLGGAAHVSRTAVFALLGIEFVIGALLATRAALRAAKARGAGGRMPGAAWAAIAFLVAYVAAYSWPNFVRGADGMDVNNYFVTDILYFAGMSASGILGLPFEEFRFAGTQTQYHFLSLLGTAQIAVFGQLPHTVAISWVFTPIATAWTGLCGAALVRAARPSAPTWAWVGALIATPLVGDVSSFLGFFGSGGGVVAWFNEPVPVTLLSNPSLPFLLFNPPFAASIALTGAAWVAWVSLRDVTPAARGGVVAALIFAAGFSKATVTLVVLPGFGVVLAWRLITRRRASRPVVDAAVVCAVLLAGFLLLLRMKDDSGRELIMLAPLYLVEFLGWRWESEGLVALGGLPGAARLALWLPLVLGWQLAMFAARADDDAPEADRAVRELVLATSVALAAGFCAINLFSSAGVSGVETYFVSSSVALCPALAWVGIATLAKRGRRALLAPVVVMLALSAIGPLHMAIGKALDSGRSERHLPPAQLEMLDWVREETPLDARLLYFRYTVIDGDTKVLNPPLNEQYYVLSGLGERAVFTEGSLYGELFLHPMFDARRIGVHRFYSQQKTPSEAAAFLAQSEIDYVVTERGLELESYAELLTPVFRNDDYRVYAVRQVAE